jgi:hypothetical protein
LTGVSAYLLAIGGTEKQIIGPEQQDLDGVLPVLFWLLCMAILLVAMFYVLID